MSHEEREKMKAWVANWKQTGEELERLKWEELQAMDESSSAHVFNKLGMGWVESWRSPERETGHGMIMQQDCFRKAHATQRRS
jgi:hypothetical protein